MTAARVAMFAAAGALFTAWLVGAGSARTDSRVPSSQASGTASTAPSAADLQEQTRRLRAGIEAAPAPRVTDRNPFAFAPERRREPAPLAQPGEVSSMPSPSAVELQPVLHLVGIATEGDTYTAAISAAGQVVLVRVGDTVAGRYVVTAISPDVVELADELGGPVIRLGLR
jgi:Tfp pilus assembly protein PilP